MQPEFKVALGQPLVGVADGLPAAAVPDHHGAAAIFALWDHPFELAIFERVILGHHSKALLCGVQARALGDGPALQHAVMLEPEIEMSSARGVLLDDEAVPGLALALGRRLRRLAEVSLSAIRRKRVCRLRPHHDSKPIFSSASCVRSSWWRSATPQRACSAGLCSEQPACLAPSRSS